MKPEFSLVWLNVCKDTCFSVPREEGIICNGTNDSDKISLLFPFEKTHPNTPQKKAPQAPNIYSSRKISVHWKNKDRISVKAMFCISCSSGPNKIIVRLLHVPSFFRCRKCQAGLCRSLLVHPVIQELATALEKSSLQNSLICT